MELLKKIHRNNNQIDFKSIWNEGLFIFDSNVLLDLYRLPISAREDLFNVFQNEKFKDRIWIGFQVLLEFLNNRLTVISDQKNKFNQVKKMIESTILSYDESFKNLETDLKKLKLTQRHSLIEPEKYINEKNLNNSKTYLNEFIKYLDELEKQQFDVHDDDEIKEKVLKIFDGRTGKPFDKVALEKVFSEGVDRYRDKLPPGYMDIGKEEVYHYEDKKFIRKYGDLLLWKEIIEKCKTEKIKYAVLVTGDIKDDWWLKKRGKKLSARIELLNEIYSEVTNLNTFYMYDTSSFLQYAKREIDSNIKDSSITETKELIELSNQNRIISKENKLISNIKLEKELHDIEKKYALLKGKLRMTKLELNNLSALRDQLFNESENTDKMRVGARNFGLAEVELQEEVERLEKRLNELDYYKKELAEKYFKSKNNFKKRSPAEGF